eukprot:PhM_4_TR17220/c0_g1_i1/m.101277
MFSSFFSRQVNVLVQAVIRNETQMVHQQLQRAHLAACFYGEHVTNRTVPEDFFVEHLRVMGVLVDTVEASDFTHLVSSRFPARIHPLDEGTARRVFANSHGDGEGSGAGGLVFSKYVEAMMGVFHAMTDECLEEPFFDMAHDDVFYLQFQRFVEVCVIHFVAAACPETYDTKTIFNYSFVDEVVHKTMHLIGQVFVDLCRSPRCTTPIDCACENVTVSGDEVLNFGLHYRMKSEEIYASLRELDIGSGSDDDAHVDFHGFVIFIVRAAFRCVRTYDATTPSGKLWIFAHRIVSDVGVRFYPLYESIPPLITVNTVLPPQATSGTEVVVQCANYVPSFFDPKRGSRAAVFVSLSHAADRVVLRASSSGTSSVSFVIPAARTFRKLLRHTVPVMTVDNSTDTPDAPLRLRVHQLWTAIVQVSTNRWTWSQQNDRTLRLSLDDVTYPMAKNVCDLMRSVFDEFGEQSIYTLEARTIMSARGWANLQKRYNVADEVDGTRNYCFHEIWATTGRCREIAMTKTTVSKARMLQSELEFNEFVALVFRCVSSQLDEMPRPDELEGLIEDALTPMLISNNAENDDEMPFRDPDDLMPSRLGTPDNTSRVQAHMDMTDAIATLAEEADRVQLTHLLKNYTRAWCMEVDAVKEKKELELVEAHKTCRSLAETSVNIHHQIDCLLHVVDKLKEHVAETHDWCRQERQARLAGHILRSDTLWSLAHERFQTVARILAMANVDALGLDRELHGPSDSETLLALSHTKKRVLIEKLIAVDFTVKSVVEQWERTQELIDSEAVQRQMGDEDEHRTRRHTITLNLQAYPAHDGSDKKPVQLRLNDIIEWERSMIEAFEIRMGNAKQQWTNEFKTVMENFQKDSVDAIDDLVDLVNEYNALFGDRITQGLKNRIEYAIHSAGKLIGNSYAVRSCEVPMKSRETQCEPFHPDAKAFTRGRVPADVTYYAHWMQSGLIWAMESFTSPLTIECLFEFAVGNIKEVIEAWFENQKKEKEAMVAKLSKKKRAEVEANASNVLSTKYQIVLLNLEKEKVISLSTNRRTSGARSTQSKACNAEVQTLLSGSVQTVDTDATTTSLQAAAQSKPKKKLTSPSSGSVSSGKQRSGSLLGGAEAERINALTEELRAMSVQLESHKTRVELQETAIKKLEAYKARAEKMKKDLFDVQTFAQQQYTSTSIPPRCSADGVTQMSPLLSMDGSFSTDQQPGSGVFSRKFTDAGIHAVPDVSEASTATSKPTLKQRIESAMPKIVQGGNKRPQNVSVQCDMGESEELREQHKVLHAEKSKLERQLTSVMRANRVLLTRMRISPVNPTAETLGGHEDVDNGLDVADELNDTKEAGVADLHQHLFGGGRMHLFELPFEDGKTTATTPVFEHNTNMNFEFLVEAIGARRRNMRKKKHSNLKSHLSATSGSSTLVALPPLVEREEALGESNDYFEALLAVLTQQSDAAQVGQSLMAWFDAITSFSSEQILEQYSLIAHSLETHRTTMSRRTQLILNACRTIVEGAVLDTPMSATHPLRGACEATRWFCDALPLSSRVAIMEQHSVENRQRESNNKCNNTDRCDVCPDLILQLLEQFGPRTASKKPFSPKDTALSASALWSQQYRWLMDMVQDHLDITGTCLETIATQLQKPPTSLTPADRQHIASTMHLTLLQAVMARERRQDVFGEAIRKLRLTDEESETLLQRHVLTEPQEAVRRRLLHQCCGNVVPLYTASDVEQYRAVAQLHTSPTAQILHERYQLTSALLGFSYDELAWVNSNSNAEAARRRLVLHQQHEVLMTSYKLGDLRRRGFTIEEWLAVTRQLISLTILADFRTTVQSLQDACREKCIVKAKRKLAPPRNGTPMCAVSERQIVEVDEFGPMKSESAAGSAVKQSTFLTDDIGEPVGPPTLPMLNRPSPVKLPPLASTLGNRTLKQSSTLSSQHQHLSRTLSAAESAELMGLRRDLDGPFLSVGNGADDHIRRWVSLELKQCLAERRETSMMGVVTAMAGQGWESNTSFDVVVRRMTTRDVLKVLKAVKSTATAPLPPQSS